MSIRERSAAHRPSCTGCRSSTAARYRLSVDRPTAKISTSAGSFTVEATDAVTSVRQIRYATAERFAPSVIVETTEGDQRGLESGAICPQIPSALDRLLSLSDCEMSEDCLFLDVHTPAIDDARRPVIVWIHGGAFVTGAGSLPWYDGSNLAQRGDVVVVTINYRLGAFGFTGTDDLGLSDQLTALEWVQRHIVSFGGDPERVTIVGESAGGASVIALMAARRSETLFAQAWAMSPSLPQIRSTGRARRAAAELIEAAGLSDDDHDSLRRLTSDELLAAQAVLLEHRSSALTAFAPTVPGALISDLSDAHRDPRPLVIGTTRDEMQLFTAFDAAYASMAPDEARRRISHRFDQPDDVLALYRHHRHGATLGQLVSAIQTDEMFRAPALELLRARCDLGTQSWSYWFTKSTPAFGGVLGACHGLDIPYLFDNLDQPGVEMFTGSDPNRSRLATQMSSDLIEFATAGTPSWPAYDTTSRPTRIYDDTTEDQSDSEPELRSLWENSTGRSL